MDRRLLATVLVVSFLSAALVPLAGASTETTYNGDIVINGKFANTAPAGHPGKLYCDPNNPTPIAGPEGECAHANEFVAYDWTTAVEMLDNVSVVPGGIRLVNNSFVQQHFNGSDAPDRRGQFYALEIVARSNGTGPASFRAELRANTTGTPTAENYGKVVTVGTSSTTVRILPGDLTGYAGAPSFTNSDMIGLRAVRLWANAGADLVIERVSVYATNGIEGRNVLILPTGDDELTQLDGVGILNPSDDGKYSFLVGMARDDGEFLYTQDAWVCAFDAEQSVMDTGYPNNTPDKMCVDGIFDAESSRITKTRVGNAIRVDVPADMVAPQGSEVPLVSFYAHVKVDGSYRNPTGQTSAQFQSGYFNLPRMAAAQAGAGVALEYPFPTPVMIDANGDGTPDYVQTDEMDGYSVIITPRRSVQAPTVAVVAPTLDGFYEFEVQVFAYDGAEGAAIPLTHGIAFALFNGSGLVNGGQFDATPFWASEGDSHQSLVDSKTMLVRVPASAVENETVAGAWAFYDVQAPFRWNVASEPYGGYSQSATDFFSVTRNTVKDFAVADALRAVGTPILFDADGVTAMSTTVIRMDPESDVLTPLDGTVVVSDGDDGTITFEYALYGPDGVHAAVNHGFAIYDAAGAVSDDLQPGVQSELEHAEWVGQGTLQANGWYRVDVPVSAFAEVKGPVGAWAFANTGTEPAVNGCCSTWYNPLKETVAEISPGAAGALYGPTPIVILDEQLGIPASLASALQGLGSGVFSASNPLVNPGFEANLLVEGRKDTADSTGATMTSPPWFFRLDDGGGAGRPTNPKSTHEVVAGEGRLGDSALKVKFHYADHNKTLMLGQLLGVEAGETGLVWRNATSVAFDVKTTTGQTLSFNVGLRYLNETGAVKMASVSKSVLPSSGWQRVTVPLAVNGELLGLYIVMSAPSSQTFYIDNVAIAGAKTEMGDARSDLSDGYAMVIEPQGLTGLVQGRIQGATGQFYLYNVTVVDYRGVSPSALDTAAMAKVFGLRTEALTKGLGTILPLRGVSDEFVAALPLSQVPQTPAAPWAWVGTGESYDTFGSSFVSTPASGYYSPVKNALAGASFADQLDYAGTPVVFDTEVAGTQVAQQRIEFAPAPGGGWLVRVTADSPFVETTTVSVKFSNVDAVNYSVTLQSASGDYVPGLVLTNAQLETATITTASTLFTAGDSVIAGSPIAQFEFCRASQIPLCVGTGILSREELLFRSTSASPAGETLTHIWNFGDGSAPSTETDVETAHTYARPGTYTVNLTVQSASGKKGYLELPVLVANRAPSVPEIDITPNPVNANSLVVARARVTDVDGNSLTYAWKLDGVAIENVNGPTLRLTPEVLLAATGSSVLDLATYTVAVEADDNQGAPVVFNSTTFTVVPVAPTVAAPVITVVDVTNATYALPNETISVVVAVADPDEQATGVVLRGLPDGDLALAETTPGVWTGEFLAPQPAVLSLTGVATTATSEVAGAATPLTVLADTVPVLELSGPSLLQSGEEGNFSVAASDPDNRTLGEISWTDNGDAAATGATYTNTFTGMGDHVIKVAVDGAEAELLLAVDDVITVTVEIVDAPENVTDDVVVKVTVLDVFGAPVANAEVLVEEFASLFPAATRSRTLYTDATGTVTFTAEPGVAGVLALPVDHRIVATAYAASLAGAPVQDEETAAGEATYGPGGVPLMLLA